MLKCCGKTPFFTENCMLILRIIFRRYAMMMAVCVALVLTKHESLAQTPYDAPARISLANEINQTYGTLVTSPAKGGRRIIGTRPRFRLGSIG